MTAVAKSADAAIARSGNAALFRIALIELAIVMAALVFVRKEVYTSGQFKALIFCWQEYVLLVLVLLDGFMRGFLISKGRNSSPLRNRTLAAVLGVALFLFVACSSLCDKLNVACFHFDWYRNLGLSVLASGLALAYWTERTRPPQLVLKEKAITVLSDPEKNQPNASTTGSADGDYPHVVRAADWVETADQVPSEEFAKAAGSTDSIERLIDEREPKGDDDEPAESTSITEQESSTNINIIGPWKWIRYPDRTSILIELIGISLTLSAWMPLLTLPGLLILFKWETADIEESRVAELGESYRKYKKRTWFLIPFLY